MATAKSELHWPSVAQFALSALAISGLWSSALATLGMGISYLLAGDSKINDPLPMFLLAASLATSGLLLVPSAFYALWRILGKQAPDFSPVLSRLHPSLWILAFPVVLLLGYWIADQSSSLVWLLLPPLHVLAIGIPVLWLMFLSVRGLPLGSPQRRWGVFGSGLALAPALIVIAEGLALMAFILLGVLSIASRPELVSELQALSEWIMKTNPSPDMILERIGPFMMRPPVILSVLVFGAVVVPVIEEACKPIGVWLLAGKDLSAAAGFAAGALSGAGYALFESLALTSASTEWAALIVARLGTGVVHIFTAGMTGWAMAIAWRQGRYALLGLTYLGAVALHGLWNALTLIFTFTTIGQTMGFQASIPRAMDFSQIAPYGLGLLTVFLFLALVTMNRALKADLLPNTPEIQGLPNG